MLPDPVPASSSSVVNREEPPSSISEPCKFRDMVERIQRYDEAAAGEFYEFIQRGLLYFYLRKFAYDVAQDLTRETILIALQAIRMGQLHEASKLGVFTLSIAKRLVQGEIDKSGPPRIREVGIETHRLVRTSSGSPEALLEADLRTAVAQSFLASLAPLDREALIRFYALEQTVQRICSDLGLTEAQYRRIKSRAKARFGELGRKTMAPRSGPAFAVAR